MKILSYKVLNEATVNLFNKNASALGGNISLNLLKTTQLSKRRGIEGASDTLKYMTRYIQLMFNFYDAQGKPKLSSDINVAFGIYFTDGGNKAHLLPYYSNSIQDLVEQNLVYATLKLEGEPIEEYLNNFKRKRFPFELEIPDINKFKEINNKYKFNSLNQLEQFANQPASTGVTIGFNASSDFRRLTLDRGYGSSQSNQGGQGVSNYTFIGFTVSSTQGQNVLTQKEIKQVNNIFQNGQGNCTITFNRPSNVLTRFLTTIEYGVNQKLNIYSSNKINPTRNFPISLGQVYIELIGATPINKKLCELSITSLR